MVQHTTNLHYICSDRTCFVSVMSHCAQYSIESQSLQWITQNQDWHREALSLHTRNSVLCCCFTVVTVNSSTCSFVSQRKPSRLKTLTVKTLHTCCNNVWKRLFDLPPYKSTILEADYLLHSTYDNCTLKTGKCERQLCLCLADHKLWKPTAEWKSNFRTTQRWDTISIQNQLDAPMYRIYFILEWHSTCFGRSFRSSSGVQDCTYSKRHLSVWQMPLAVCTVLNSWWWTERPSETCRVSFQNKLNMIQWCV